ncbi:MAG: DoxX family protein [Proteobacteria bacterium]|nr:MAG: DoxX family protein [Pseudomonadota bacterium]
MRSAGAGHAVFAATMIAVGVMGLISGDFAPILQPVPKGMPAREALVYFCAVLAMAAGICLFLRRAAAPAAGVLLGLLLVWLLLFRVPVVFRAPADAVSWESCAETLVIAAGAWVLYARLAAESGGWRIGLATGERGVHIARTLFGLALIPFGVAHFAYVKETAALVPAWLPAHVGFAYFTGLAYIAAGVAIVIGIYPRLAAALSALQMAVLTLLVWIPTVIAGPSAFQWSETVISWTLTASAWVVADSFRETRWLAVGKR